MRQRSKIKGLLAVMASCLSLMASGHTTQPMALEGTALAKAIGWTPVNDHFCGGYYRDAPFADGATRQDNHIEITGAEGIFSFRGTSAGRGKVTITRSGQEVIADHVELYRDPTSGKLSTLALNGHIILREPGRLVIADKGTLDLRSREEHLRAVFYRTSLTHSQPAPAPHALKKARIIKGTSAIGHAAAFEKTAAGILNLTDASYSTCPPLDQAWQLRAGHVRLDKDSGRGTATHARINLHGIPVFYTPWLNFPIDSRRQTGFLPPSIGSSGQNGGWLRVPFYWNMAPNYDMTLTPGMLTKRGFQLSGLFRYLTPLTNGDVTLTVLPNDFNFHAFQIASEAEFSSSPLPEIQAQLRRLIRASDTRSAITIRNNTRFNENWSGSIHYSRVSDDYYLRDLNTNLDEVTNNQLLQEGTLNYEGRYWEWTGRLQGYQALHPLDSVSAVQNQYARLPQLALKGYYPSGPFGLDAFTHFEFTRFSLSPTPGTQTLLPTGDRLHAQPGISLPIENPWFYVTPRLQFALTEYRLSQTTPPASPSLNRSLPIFDTHAGLFFDRYFQFNGLDWHQTLEPEMYYSYVPFRNQNTLPLFDTSNNTLTYDQLFIFNRFNGLDRIGDANQVSYGVTTRLLNDHTGTERFHAGIGQILYFKNRDVTIGPQTPNDRYDKSPLSGVLSWKITPEWSLNADSIWNVRTNAFDNQTIGLAYHASEKKIINLGYSFVRQGDLQAGESPNSAAANLSQTDLSFAWPVSNHWQFVGRWTHNWNHHRFQNLLYGLEYDTCCWAVRLVAARAFVGLNPAGTTFQYDTGIAFEFALKGLGNIGNNDPGQLLANSVTGYQSNFGQIT